MKFFVSTGEMSGDLHLSYLVKEILKENNQSVFYGVAGEHSESAGVNIIQDIKELAVMGFTQAVMKYRFLKKKAYEYLDFIEANNIDKVILVDYGGFNLKFLELLKERRTNIEIYYYIPPKLWVWGEKRIKSLKLADHIMVIFPWEVEFYKKHGVKAVYFGNPFIEKYQVVKNRGNEILLLPGSRKQEVKKLVPVMLEVVKKRKDEKFLLKLASEDHLGWIESDLKKYDNLKVQSEITLVDAIKRSKIALAASGTVILELALMGIPGIVLYKTNIINEFIARHILKLGFVSLPNLTLNEEVYPELLQRECNSVKISSEIDEILKNIDKMDTKIKKIRKKLSGDEIIKSYAQYVLKGSSARDD
ncbi:lipid-A-disaccharide synthase [Ilyobacter polytropus]|uniref:Lipid-A-disaccharide synthase n=1 Tax=Ilyobacter polytropus (strain ATCC 51220 / DSM 2926 / LMG 16218 / CuHBu1) TaxID=572544 RepID=E3H7U0_ILYPC|nr:lipid-A-disaccharide synthase [Ilyobacter polytropus]ADO82892.1 lipid-A-disaccharide synthase [Ilyobacter polytropus DSM 2926]